MADTRFFLRVAGSSSPPAANPQVELVFGVSDPHRSFVFERRDDLPDARPNVPLHQFGNSL